MTAAPATACRAPEIELHFNPDGTVRACCVNSVPLGRIGIDRLPDLWNGPARRDLIERLGRSDFSAGCGGCAAEIELEGRPGSYPEMFDERAGATAMLESPQAPAWPTWMEFNLSNSCNLQCLQCDGELSSAIRSHRERRPPLPTVYDDQFFEDLRPFLAHLDVAQFAGGEPFLGRENFRVWDLMEEVGATATCIVVTNATQWNQRVERALGQVRMGFTLSIDAVTPETYERIRVGADYRAVMANVDRLVAHARSEGTPLSINHCLMAQNHHEFGRFLLWAEERQIPVNVSVVRGPARCAIARLPHAEIVRIAEALAAEHEVIADRLHLNRATWERELRRITQWAAADPDDIDDLWASSRHAAVLGLDGRGAGEHDDADAVRRLTPLAADGEVHRVSVASDDIIQSVSPDLPARLGLDPGFLDFAHVQALHDAVERRFGAISNYEVLDNGPDEIDAVATTPGAVVRVALVAMRDRRGRALEGRILMAIDDGRSADPATGPGPQATAEPAARPLS